MKTQVKKITNKMVGIIGMIILSSFITIQPKATVSWIAPAEANALVNPLKGDFYATQDGKKTFNQMCVICHGEKGKGDGFAGATLTPRPANLADGGICKEASCKETDGAIFWKLTTGKSPMASYKTILSDEKRWQLVNYIRQLQANAIAENHK